MTILSTLASKREYNEILERMDPSPIKAPRPKDPTDKVAIRYSNFYSDPFLLKV